MDGGEKREGGQRIITAHLQSDTPSNYHQPKASAVNLVIIARERVSGPYPDSWYSVAPKKALLLLRPVNGPRDIAQADGDMLLHPPGPGSNGVCNNGLRLGKDHEARIATDDLLKNALGNCLWLKPRA